MNRRPVFEDLDAAIEWLREEWSARDVPNRLHERGFEGEGPFFTPAFARYLDATPHDKAAPHSRECPRSCDCEWRYPMWRAMDALTAYDQSHPRKGYSLHELVLTLVVNSFDAEGTALATGENEATVFLAIRTLFGRYEKAPVKVGWVSKSDSQRAAEVAA